MTDDELANALEELTASSRSLTPRVAKPRAPMPESQFELAAAVSASVPPPRPILPPSARSRIPEPRRSWRWYADEPWGEN